MSTVARTHFTDEEAEAQGGSTVQGPTMASGRAQDSDEVSLIESRPLMFQVFRMFLRSSCVSNSWWTHWVCSVIGWASPFLLLPQAPAVCRASDPTFSPRVLGAAE